MEQKEHCIRCGKPTPYHPNTPIMLRRYFVEGSGQLCEMCFYELYPVPRTSDSEGYARHAVQAQGQNKRE